MSKADELFSLYTTQSLYTHGHAYSSRHGVTVVVGSQMYDYGRPSRMATTDYVRECVTDAVREYTRDRARGSYDPDKGWDITSDATYERGTYRYSVWAPKGL